MKNTSATHPPCYPQQQHQASALSYEAALFTIGSSTELATGRWAGSCCSSVGRVFHLRRCGQRAPNKTGRPERLVFRLHDAEVACLFTAPPAAYFRSAMRHAAEQHESAGRRSKRAEQGRRRFGRSVERRERSAIGGKQTHTHTGAQ